MKLSTFLKILAGVLALGLGVVVLGPAKVMGHVIAASVLGAVVFGVGFIYRKLVEPSA